VYSKSRFADSAIWQIREFVAVVAPALATVEPALIVCEDAPQSTPPRKHPGRFPVRRLREIATTIVTSPTVPTPLDAYTAPVAGPLDSVAVTLLFRMLMRFTSVRPKKRIPIR
jgi:hypothetical protein